MHTKKILTKLLAALLLVLLVQKISLGLFLHNNLHVSKHAGTEQHHSQEVRGINCSCIDDFLSPFEVTRPVVANLPASYFSELPVLREASAPVVFSLYHSLRAPPSC